MATDSKQYEKLVLIVEDDPWIREILSELLVDEGYRTREASSADEALRLIGEQLPDVVVLDLRLPDRSGVDVLGELRASPLTAELPVLVISGAREEIQQLVQSRREQLANGIIEKPLDLRQFFAQLEQVASPELGRPAG